jgi:hypothetical protein
MKAAALFAAAYGFPPSACGTQEEMLGLLQNLRMSMAISSGILARGVAVCFSSEASAELLKDSGAPTQDIIKAKLNAMRQKAGVR